MGVDVWVSWPSANPARSEATAAKWQQKGYKVAVWYDIGKAPEKKSVADFVHLRSDYRGYWRAQNFMARYLVRHQGADIVVYAADDIDPIPDREPGDIALAFRDRFPDGFGLMQPCGDPQGEVIDRKHNAARICGSAWYGDGWIERAYGGRHPTCELYAHFYADQEVMEVAERLGVLWWRPELTQLHRHWSFGHGQIAPHQEANQRHWDFDRKLFFERKAQGFPGSDPRPAKTTEAQA